MSENLSQEEKDKIIKTTIAGVAAGATPILINAGVQAGLGGIIA
jgi:hypothetical protein